eukprot:CAMPEP_0113511312 /NCGR_PEP_ID=MMETSP0014_2-20120614/38641_1 /TAXON_ID=2857 /ORGANISM="Nitzschia sp." /LENGTH=66 /DNA_ID=CAMNT_0000407399 /DNA_START=52 /DNA_END=249 /DNA_ORIENTATION=+ /assembly_acc=CAM_ASM_000159
MARHRSNDDTRLTSSSPSSSFSRRRYLVALSSAAVLMIALTHCPSSIIQVVDAFVLPTQKTATTTT